ncbi:MAG TPA: hypothetical protein DCL38_03215 [Lachnospiraceae bacterium]|nr:hypothetical protein [Lachnospiraceae bacterium]
MNIWMPVLHILIPRIRIMMRPRRTRYEKLWSPATEGTFPITLGFLTCTRSRGRSQICNYERYSMNHGKASECVKCGLCEKNCPQHINIREFLEEFSGRYQA